MGLFALLKITLLLITLAACAFEDCFEHRVPNVIIASGFAGMLAIYAASFMISVPLIDTDFLIPQLMLIVFLIFLHAAGTIGGGDVKLVMLICFSYPDCCGFTINLSGFIFAGLYALVKLVYEKRLLYRLSCLKEYISINACLANAYISSLRSADIAVYEISDGKNDVNSRETAAETAAETTTETTTETATETTAGTVTETDTVITAKNSAVAGTGKQKGTSAYGKTVKTCKKTHRIFIPADYRAATGAGERDRIPIAVFLFFGGIYTSIVTFSLNLSAV